MGGFFEHTDPALIALGVATAMLGAWGVGWWRGRMERPDTTVDPGIKFTDAALALRGPLLASAASARRR